MTSARGRRIAGLLLCLGAVAVTAGAWAFARTGEGASTDNAYVRGNITSIAARVAGYVVAVEVGDNQSVAAGDVLLRIDDRDYRARVAEAEANVEAARAGLADVDAGIGLQRALVRQAVAERRGAAAELMLAEKAAERRHELARSHSVSEAEVDQADAARERAEALLQAASVAIEAQQQRIAVLSAGRRAALAAVARAEAALALARIDLDNSVVRAPIGGVVGNRQVRVGGLVAPGVALIDLVPVDDVWVVANFKETQIGGIRPGQKARIRLDGYSGQPIEGVVDSFAPGSGASFSLLPPDNATGNFVRVVQRVPVKIRLLENPLPGRLVPGLSARVDLDGTDVDGTDGP